MTLYTDLLISGISYNFNKSMNVTSSMSINNSASSFQATFDNPGGRAGSLGFGTGSPFRINDDVRIAAGRGPVDGLVFYLKFNNSGTYITDEIQQISGISVSGPTFNSAGRFNNAFAFNGSGASGARFEFNNIPTNVRFATGSPFTISAWVNWSGPSISGIGNIVGHRIGDDVNLYISGAIVANAGFPALRIDDTEAKSNISIGSNSWYHIAGTYTGSRTIDYEHRVYVNGEVTKSGNTPDAGGFGTVGSLLIGHDKRFTWSFYGLIDDIRIYNRCLSPKEIQDLYGADDRDGRIFRGIVEEIAYSGEGSAGEGSEQVTISGRDYTARLQDAQIIAEVYNNTEVSVIVKDLIDTYLANSGITYNNVNTTSTTLTHITFKQISVFDALIQLAELSDRVFWVDVNKDLNFVTQGTISSNVTLNNTNIISSDFTETDEELYNEVYVFGDRILAQAPREVYTGTAGSIYTLVYNPHNTAIYTSVAPWNGSALLGGIFEAHLAGTGSAQYLVDYDQKQIIINSSLNPPGAGSLVADYYRAVPNVKAISDRNSIDKYGRRRKIITDKSIRSPQQVTLTALQTLSSFKEPKVVGNINARGIASLQPGNTVVVDMPWQNINNRTYDIVEVNYDFNPSNNFSETAMKVVVNDKLKDTVDTLKQIMIDIKKLQAADTENTDVLTRIELGLGSAGVRVSGTTALGDGIGWRIGSRGILNSFIMDHPINGIMDVRDDANVGSRVNPQGTPGGNFQSGGAFSYGYSWNQPATVGSGYFDCGSDPIHFMIGSFAASVWFNVGSINSSATNRWSGYISREDSTAARQGFWFGQREQNGSYYVMAELWSGNTAYGAPTAPGVGSGPGILGVWHHAVINYNDDLKTTGSPATIWIDGSAVAWGGSHATIFGIGSKTNTLQLFRRSTTYFYGQLDDIRLYNRNLTSGEIGSLFANYIYPGLKDNLIGYYTFDESSFAASNGSHIFNNGRSGIQPLMLDNRTGILITSSGAWAT